ncbi:hypothetical protein OS493_024192 [Desmophyllum pertusum]|uniref:CTHRC1 C-terminal domain-containing protein n=1 Tax=Desmophyllum pertusum TaxID=174260 RepID=A0A9W9ZAP6_9CNID|nr:hypothetical protein OS493_024192 [Desmophyllum pertusum]
MAATLPLLFLYFAIFKTIVAQGDIVWTQPECREMMETCELLSGLPGPPGPVGPKGITGAPGIPGLRGDKGLPGEPGKSPVGGGGFPVKGQKGERGVIGRKGAQGWKGAAGRRGGLGSLGSWGTTGMQGDRGDRGETGLRGIKGEPGVSELNWKQCMFKPDINTPRGELNSCTFVKTRNETSLHVTYQGETHIGLCKSCCKTWYFTFDKLTCTDPGSINAAFSALHLAGNDAERNTLPVFMHGSISGYCSSVPGGLVRVGISLDDCPGYPKVREIIPAVIQPNSRLIIQEVPAPQV